MSATSSGSETAIGCPLWPYRVHSSVNPSFIHLINESIVQYKRVNIVSGAEFAYENNNKSEKHLTEKCFMEIVVQERNIINHYHPNMSLPKCLQDSSPKQFDTLLFGENPITCYHTAAVCISIKFAPMHIDWWTAALGRVWFCHHNGSAQWASRKCLLRLIERLWQF